MAQNPTTQKTREGSPFLTETDSITTEEETITERLDIGDGVKSSFGTDSDFSMHYDSGGDQFIVYDDTNDVELFRFNKKEAAEAPQGIETGPLETVTDPGVLTLADAPVSDTPAAGDEESYTFAIDATNLLKAYAEADGAGGIQNPRLKAFKHLDLADTNRRTLTGDITLVKSDSQVQNIDPGGATRIITLPAVQNGLEFIIGNRAGAAEDLTINDDGGATIATVNQDNVGRFISDGTGWVGFVSGGGVS